MRGSDRIQISVGEKLLARLSKYTIADDQRQFWEPNSEGVEEHSDKGASENSEQVNAGVASRL
jgi:hypothetical protein